MKVEIKKYHLYFVSKNLKAAQQVNKKTLLERFQRRDGRDFLFDYSFRGQESLFFATEVEFTLATLVIMKWKPDLQ